MRIGERSLERVPVRLQSRGEFLGTGFEDLEPARIHGCERRLALDQMDRGTPPGPRLREQQRCVVELEHGERYAPRGFRATCQPTQDRKSTRLNSSHSQISYAVFCLKKKKK